MPNEQFKHSTKCSSCGIPYTFDIMGHPIKRCKCVEPKKSKTKRALSKILVVCREQETDIQWKLVEKIIERYDKLQLTVNECETILHILDTKGHYEGSGI